MEVYNLAYEAHGKGTPLILLHGFPLNRKMWEPQIDTLLQHCRLILPDLRGFGDSSWSGKALSIDEIADDVIQLMNSLSLDSAVIGGFSMGGYIALSIVDRYPTRVSGLILMDTHPKADNKQNLENRKRMAKVVEKKGTEAITKEMVKKLLTAHTLKDHPEIVQKVFDIMEQSTPTAIIQALQAMANRPDRSHVLPQFKKPALVLVGEKDEMSPPDLVKEMQSQLPNSNLALIENAGHLANMERPDEVNQAIISFIDVL